MQNQQWHLISHGRRQALHDTDAIAVKTHSGEVQLLWERLEGGKSNGVDMLTIDTGSFRTAILPTRGMSLWKCWVGDIEFGWQSPCEGPVHPSLVPISDPSGLGWLDGFDEFLVRCGLHSNGAPEFDERGHLKHSLHGRIGNLPAHSLQVEIDPLADIVDIRGVVDELRFLIYGLRLETHIRLHVGRSSLTISDTVTNLFTRPTTMQMLYHINIGQPILEAGSKLMVPVQQIAPRDTVAAANIDRWDTFDAPTDGFAEQVHFVQPYADANGWSTAMVHDVQGEKGLAVRFDTRTLPYLIFWKNAMAVEEGYVLGIEPATGFPNVRSFEEARGRLVQLVGGQSITFRVELDCLSTRYAVRQALDHVQSLQKSPIQIARSPMAGWSST